MVNLASSNNLTATSTIMKVMISLDRQVSKAKVKEDLVGRDKMAMAVINNNALLRKLKKINDFLVNSKENVSNS